MDWMEFVKPELAVLIPVLYLLGMALKKWGRFTDKHIPLGLMGAGVLLAGLWLLAKEPLAGPQTLALLAFGAIVQGVLCAGAAVLGNQVWKQEAQGSTPSSAE